MRVGTLLFLVLSVVFNIMLNIAAIEAFTYPDLWNPLNFRFGL